MTPKSKIIIFALYELCMKHLELQVYRFLSDLEKIFIAYIFNYFYVSLNFFLFWDSNSAHYQPGHLLLTHNLLCWIVYLFVFQSFFSLYLILNTFYCYLLSLYFMMKTFLGLFFFFFFWLYHIVGRILVPLLPHSTLATPT